MFSERARRLATWGAAIVALTALIFAAILQLSHFEGGISVLESDGRDGDYRITDVHRALTQIPADSSWINTSRALKAKDLAGRVLLLDFWTYACINCLQSIPDLQFLEAKYKDKLTVIGVHSGKFANEKESESIRSAVVRHGVDHPVVNDEEFLIWNSFGAKAWPTFVLISPDGVVSQIYSGEGHRDELDRDIRRLTAHFGGQINTEALPLAPERDRRGQAQLSFPSKMAFARDVPAPGSTPAEKDRRRHSGIVFVSDAGHHRILGIDLDGRIVFAIGRKGEAGHVDGSLEAARFHDPQGLAYRKGVLYVADRGNHSVRAIRLGQGTVTTIAGTGRIGYARDVKNAPAPLTPMASPWDLAFFPDDRHLAIALAGNHQLWVYDLKTKTVSVLAGSGAESIRDGHFPANALAQPSGLSVHDGKLYFVDSETSSLRFVHGRGRRRGEVTTLVGKGLFDFGFEDGPAAKAMLQHPLGVQATASGIYVADSYNHAVRRFDPRTGALETVVGNGSPGLLNEPADIEQTPSGLLVTDTNHHQIEWLRIDEKGSARLEPMKITGDPQAAPAGQKDRLSPAGTSGRTLARFLPNSKRVEVAPLAAGSNTTVRLKLEDDWKINDTAPSWLAVFNEDGKLVREYSREEVRTEAVKLPPLEPGNYRLQGSFFFCRKDRPDVCVVQSVNEKLSAEKSGRAAPIEIPVRR